jgi:hypothetical protein
MSGRLLSEKERDMLAAILSSTEACAKALFPDRFTLPFSKNHHKVMKLLDDDSIQLLAIAADRGFGKSSLVQLAFPARKTLARQVAFMVPISCTSTQAIMHSENFKRELECNPFINEYFPPIKTDVFAKDMWIMNNPKAGRPGTLVFPRGRGQQVRGFLHGNERPDLIIVDDLEDAESVQNQEQRAKVLEWFYADVLGCVDRSKKNWRIVVIGTVLHEDSLLSNLITDPAWTSVRLELCDDDFHSNWPEKISDEGVKELVEWYRNQGLLDVFYREYRNQPIARESAPFKPENFAYYSPSELSDPNIQRVVIMDPARTTNKTACDTAIVGVGVDLRNGIVYVIDLVADRLHPDEQARECFAMADRLNATTIGYEVDGLEQYSTWNLVNIMRTSGRNYELVPLRAKKGKNMYSEALGDGKDARIAEGLVALYRQGRVKHNKNHPLTAKLEAQLLQFPRSKKKDVIDALSYISQMFSIGERQFMAPIPIDITASQRRNGLLDACKEKAALDKLRSIDRQQKQYAYN